MAEIRQSLADDDDPLESGIETAGFGARVVSWLSGEPQRRVLWLPVALGLGVAVYFALPVEPPLWSGPALVVVAAVAALSIRDSAARALPLAILMTLAVVGIGIAASSLRTSTLDGPLVTREMRPMTVIGAVRAVEPWSTGNRLLIDVESGSRLPLEEMPARVRINVRTRGDAAAPGDRVSVLAVLRPLPEPVTPGGFDFGRYLYFQGIGAVGYAVGPVRIEAGAETETGWRVAVERVRHRIAERIDAALDGDSGAVARALLTGQKGAIPTPVIEAMRGAGLAHLLAISGLHIGLVAATLFFALRAVLAAIEPIALRLPVKKIAAACALGGAGLYLLITGMTVPTQRAFLMVAVVIFAVLIDRTAISMRLVAWAAGVILLLRPESLLSVSFQLSFAAVVALVAAFEALRRPRLERRQRRAAWRGPATYFAGVAISSAVATLATAPFAAYHFNRVAAFGLIANMIAVPTTAFWIMPAGIAALLLMPFGLESMALAPMGWGIDVVVRVATTVAGWPGAVLHVDQMPLASLVAISLGGLWLCLWVGRRRWWGVAAIVAGIAAWPLAAGPDIQIDGDGGLMAVRDADGQLAVSTRRKARFSREQWLARNGQTEPAPWAGADGHWADGGLRCDSLGCLYRRRGRIAALITAPDALAEDCAIADLVVSTVPVWDQCAGPEMVIDRFDLWRDGAHAVWLGDDLRVRAVRPSRGVRPWVVAPR